MIDAPPQKINGKPADYSTGVVEELRECYVHSDPRIQ